ncbi:MAG: HD domain-containing protein [Candidatus Hydrogenedentes bacterium]|nr:HD domain-containing protein [Candidatus Hydrogenedentota bacterium]
MKRQYVQSLQDGDTVNDYYIAVRKDVREQQKGGKFLGMVFKDRSGEIGGILWTNAVAVAKLFELGDVVNVRGVVTSYQDRLQIRVDQVLPMREEEYDLADLIYTPENADEIKQRFRAVMETISNEWLRKLVFAFLDDETFMKRFTTAAAGKKWHHAFRGGLLQHCCELARFALAAAEVFPRLDRDVLLTGVLVHDIGKLDELSQDLVVDYTTAGKLLGHLAIGAEMVQQRINAIPGFPEPLRLQVLHCVWSHHGEMVNGSPVVPKTVEALVLYHIDNLDAQTDAFFRIMDETRDKGQAWSEYIQMIDRQVWTKERM